MSRNFDVAIIGGGFAGLSAALTVARLGHSAVVLAEGVPGGELVKIGRIDGIPGFEDGIAGYDLCPITQEQAEEQGVEILDAPATALVAQGDNWLIETAQDQITARGVVVATGTALATLDVPGIDALAGKGVSDCASCDAPLLRGKVAVVAGGGDSAMQEALVLAEYLEKVIMVVQGATLTGQKPYIDAVLEADAIECRYSSEPVAVLGEDGVTGVRVKDLASGAEEVIATDAIFTFIGLVPNSAIVNGIAALDDTGRIAVDSAMRSSAFGICAAGNVRQHSPHRAAAAMGDAAAAAVALDRYFATGQWRDA